MKKLGLLSMSVLLLFIVAACEREPAEEAVIFNEATGRFEIEDGAQITLGVDSDPLGLALVEQWNEDFPELEGMLTFTNYDAQNAEDGGMEGLELMQDEAPDVALVIDNELIGRENAVRSLHEYFIPIGENQTHEIFDEVNILGTFLLPAFYDGMVFSWNRTMLEAWGVDVDDVNEYNLPVEMESWEKIFDYAAQYGTDPADRPTFDDTTILEFFPISVAEPWSAYSSLSSGGWQIYADGDYADPQFEDPEFLEGLKFMEAFSQTNMSIDETGSIRSAGAMDWRWENYLEGDYPFGLVGTWMDVEGYMEDTGYTFEFSTIPTWEGNQLSALYKTKGFVINSSTPYPSAASEVLRWLYTGETMETMINNSAYLPALQDDAEIYPEVEAEFKADMTAGLRYARLEPAATLPENPTRRAMSVYYDIGVADYLMELWDGDRTPESAQDGIVDSADIWMENNNTLD